MKLLATALLAAMLLTLGACGGEEKTGGEVEKAEADAETAAESWEAEEILSYTSDDVSFGIYFDEEGTQRTVKLADGQRQLPIYIVVRYPEEMSIGTVEYRLELPEGVHIESDSFYEKRILSMGTFQAGITEGFGCVNGPELLLHKLTLGVEKPLENAAISILPHKQTGLLGVVKCEEGYPELRAGSYKAVINPVE